MNQNVDMKRAAVKAVLIMIVVALGGFFLLNGFGGHPYEKGELEKQFRAAAAERNVKSGEGEIFRTAEMGNSVTFLLESPDGDRACATYVQSMFNGKFKEHKFYSGATGVLALDTFAYAVNDGVSSYELNLTFGENASIQQSGKVAPILYIKVLGVCVVMMGIFGSRAFRRKK